HPPPMSMRRPNHPTTSSQPSSSCASRHLTLPDYTAPRAALNSGDKRRSLICVQVWPFAIVSGLHVLRGAAAGLNLEEAVDQSDGGGGHSLDAAGLAEGTGTHPAQCLHHLAREAAAGRIVEPS